jgi:hypothetical protein
MDQLRYSAAWLPQWRDEITDAVSSMMSTFEETYGYGQARMRSGSPTKRHLGLRVTTVGSSWDSRIC